MTQETDNSTVVDEPAAGGEFGFQAEVSRLLDLVVHSVYSEREVFLRELISNAADALDKLRYQAVQDAGLTVDEGALKITLRADPETKQLVVSDNGIGMSRDELINNLGTIARSGTKAFLESLDKETQKTSAQIGQFGVGFYAAFMVADHVDVISRRVGESQAHVWSSDGKTGFDVRDATADEAALVGDHGTRIILHMRDDAGEFLEPVRLEHIVRTYSDHVPFPIELIEPAKEKADGDDAEDKDGKQDEPAAETHRQLNEAGALWRKSPQEIDEAAYTEFYRHISHNFDEPALTIHYRAEGRHEFTVLLFIPREKPFDLFDPDRRGRVKLYVRQVFITDDADILPPWLRFVRGVIDSEDMPLNISREMLQNNPIVAAIRKAVTSRVLKELTTLAKKDPEQYNEFWSRFGMVLKEGLAEDLERRDELYELARFKTTKGDEWRSLKDYVADLKENQTAIYYLTGESKEALAASPHLEGYRARDIEVLLLSDPVDSFWVASATGYDGKPFKSITQGEAELEAIALKDEAAEKAKDEPSATELTGLIEQVKKVLGEAVSDVKTSGRLVESPACLVASQFGMDRTMSKIMSRHQGGEMKTAPVLEINPRHDWVRRLGELAAESGADPAADSRFADYAWLLLDQAKILDGELPDDPAKFAHRLSRIALT